MVFRVEIVDKCVKLLGDGSGVTVSRAAMKQDEEFLHLKCFDCRRDRLAIIPQRAWLGKNVFEADLLQLRIHI